VSILENLELSGVKPGRYFLLAQPVKIGGVDGAPVRAVLLDGYLFWSK
jgi:arylformamidase